MQHPGFTDFLNKADLTRPLLSLGAELVRQTVDILGNMPLEPVFFEQSPIEPGELEPCKFLVERLKKRHYHQLSALDRDFLLEVALRFVPGKHKMAGLPAILETLILEGRALFRDRVSEQQPGLFDFYDPSYNFV